MLSIINPLQRYNMALDDYGNLVIVNADSWASAHYFAYGFPKDQFFSL